jgi:hypothetical protein
MPMNYAMRKPKPAPNYLFRGEMRTAREIANVLGVAKGRVTERLKTGQSPDDWMPAKVTLYPFRGEMLSVMKIAELLGLCIHTVRDRIKRGLPLDTPKREPADLAPLSAPIIGPRRLRSGMMRGPSNWYDQ